MSDTAVIATLVFLFILVVFVSLRYHEEVRALFARLEKFRADRRGIESTFSPPSERQEEGAGSPDEPSVEEIGHELGQDERVDDQEKIDLQTVSDLDVLHREMVAAGFRSDVDRAKEARDRYREVADDVVEADRVDALFDALIFDSTGDQASFKRLRSRAEDPRIAAYVEYLTGIVLENVKQSAEAADAYKRALEAAKDPEFRAKLVGSRAKMLTEIRNADLAEQEVKIALRGETDLAARAALWRALAGIYEAREQFFDQAVALQEARGYEPNNSRLCFSIGWALSQSERTDVRGLAIYFYRLAIYLDPKNEYALNNLGWEYSKAGMPIKATEYYMRAAALENTLAMANLAGVKLNAGLAEEAEQIVKDAQKQEKVHENVASVQTDISRAQSEQEAKATNLEKDGAQLAEFCSRVVRAELCDGPTRLPRQWHWASGGSVDLSLSQRRLTLEWTAEGAKKKIEAVFVGRSARGELFKMGSRFSALKGERTETSWEEQQSALLIVDNHDIGIKVALFSQNSVEFSQLQPGEDSTA